MSATEIHPQTNIVRVERFAFHAHGDSEVRQCFDAGHHIQR